LLDGFVLLSVGLSLGDLDWIDTCRALAGCSREWPLSRGEPRDGMATGGFSRTDGRSSRALVAALWLLTVGHLLATLVVILPFSLLLALVQWQRHIQIGASLLVVGFGIFRFVNRRHPRALARIRPTQLGLWSFAVARSVGGKRARGGIDAYQASPNGDHHHSRNWRSLCLRPRL
jgi:hypothetical protein